MMKVSESHMRGYRKVDEMTFTVLIENIRGSLSCARHDQPQAKF